MAKIVGTVFLKKINPADAASVSKNVTLKLISFVPAKTLNPVDGNKVIVGNEARLEGIPNFGAAKSKFSVIFHWNVDEMGTPEVFHISNNLSHEFFLESLTFDDIPNHGRLHFACDSWISPKEGERTFFINKAYLPSETPKPLKYYREKELETLRGNGRGERQTWERIYDYDVYNDLGNPDLSTELGRPVLGGSSALPYPRRGRTGRPRTQKDSASESIPRDENIKFYVPRDEEFGDIKLVELGKGLPKVITQRYLLKLLESQRLGISVPSQVYETLKAIGFPKKFLQTDGKQYLVKLPPIPIINPSDFKVDGPQISETVIAAEVLKVVNRDLICPITLQVKPSILGNSKFTEGFPQLHVNEKIQKGQLSILDYHPHNTSDESYAATRTIFYDDNVNGTITKRLLAIEISVPEGDERQLFVPRPEDNGYSLWILAVAYVLVNDSIIRRPRPINTLAPFNSFGDVREKLYGKNFGIPVPLQVYKTLKSVGYPDEFLLTHGERYFVKLQFPTPSVIKEDVFAWMTDEEFARQMLAGLNPNVIRRIEDKIPLNSEPVKEELRKKLEELMKFMTTLPADKVDYIEQAIEKKKLFILDYLEAFKPYLKKINDETSNKGYATRTFLFLKDDGTLTPLAIELSLPKGDNNVQSEYYFPAKDGVEGSRWLLAKAYVNVNDSGYHQLISHWLNTHAVIEPFIIATNRQLSVLHPVHKLLRPHFRDTMRINADARRNLISANGIIESSFFPGKYAMQLSSEAYKNWDFTEQALPKDLIKRGMAVKDDKEPYGLRLLIKDYPYATDGLEIWNAIKTWVQDYVYYYYKTNDNIQKDPELQAWWKELVEVGHGDLKDKTWWPKMQTREHLIESCTIIIWIASALHAAVNFGQFPYGGYILNRPTLSKRLMPGTDELKNKEKAFLQTFTPTPETLIVVSILEILSTHTSDEVYLGTRDNPKDWTSDAKPLEDFEKFKKKLEEIEKRMVHMNEKRLKNRIGQVKMPYTLLYPSSEPGVTGRGIPNSISI